MSIPSIASVTSTVCRLFGVEPPALASESALEPILDHARHAFGPRPVQRCLIFCPDALGNHLWPTCREHVETIATLAPLAVQVTSVFPPKTPVCFASMFTGARPDQHGIRRYERPVLKCDTLFDALLRAGKRTAIVAVRDSSVDLIFRERPLDYFSEDYDPEVADRAEATLASDSHELVVVYQQEYDDLLHETSPHSEPCLRAVGHHAASFRRLAQAARSAWAAYDHAIVFAPDHGAHLDPRSGKGDHGLDIPEDMSLCHWYGLFAAGL